MPSRATYVLRISGRLDGPAEKNSGAADAFKNGIFRKPGKSAVDSYKDPWPNGIWLPGYELCQWEPRAEDCSYVPAPDAQEKPATLLDFRAELNSTKKGQLYQNWGQLKIDIEWFYNYPTTVWHPQLYQLLIRFNQDYKEKVIDKIWFCEWQWYCGNGGGM